MDESLTLIGFTTGFGPSVMPEMFIEDDKAATAAAHCVDPLRLFGVGDNFARDPVSTPSMVVFLIGDCVCCLHHIYDKMMILIIFTIYIHASKLFDELTSAVGECNPNRMEILFWKEPPCTCGCQNQHDK